MKKIILLLLALAVIVTSAAFATSCAEETPENNDNEKTCTEHKDADTDGKCDSCGAEVEIKNEEDENNGNKDDEAKEVTVTFTVKDQDEAAIAGITAFLTGSSEGATESISATSSSDGKITLKLNTGSYSVDYDYDVEAVGYYISDTHSITVTETSAEISLYLINNNPNGSEERPFAFSVGENEIKIPAGEGFYYIVYRAINLFLDVEGEGIKITYGEETYTPDADGKIHFALRGTDINSVEQLLIENTGSAELSCTVSINSAPGTLGNPYIIESAGADVTAEKITSSDIVYYSYVATAKGTFSITIKSEGTNASMVNARNSVAVSTADTGENLITLELEAGDELIIDISTSVDGEVDVVFLPEFTPAE